MLYKVKILGEKVVFLRLWMAPRKSCGPITEAHVTLSHPWTHTWGPVSAAPASTLKASSSFTKQHYWLPHGTANTAWRKRLTPTTSTHNEHSPSACSVLALRQALGVR